MSDAVVIAVIAGIPGVLSGFFAYIQSKRANDRSAQAQMSKIEAGAYERARKLYEDGIRQLEEQLDRLKRQITEEQDVSDILRRRVRELEVTVEHLRQQLYRSGTELAPAEVSS
jgi:septal ring factor EnvC (AmiA/AmiB activator)